MMVEKTSIFLGARHNIQASLLRPSAAPYVCRRCQLQTRRTITRNFLQRKEEGREQWAEFAKEIRAGKRESMLSILEKRGFIHATAGERDAVDRLMIDKRVGVYCGIDPTAPSMHVGHMVSLMAMFWMFLHGFHTVSLLGGSTARIGDPTGRTTSRMEMTSSERKANIAAMHYQIKRLWVNCETLGRKYGFVERKHHHREIVNNAVWWNKLSFMDVLKYLGRGLRLGPMLSRDTVKTKMESGDGMSFSEFCYPIMQAWDFWQMYDEKDVQMQIGGQDQFGNIVAGIDAVKFTVKNHPDPDIRAPEETGIAPDMMPVGFTVPLLTTASGEKFGKSAGNAVWLDAQMTSLFDLYGFFVRTADVDVDRYLKLFTFLPLPEIQSIVDKHKLEPSKRAAQHVLAYEFLRLIHGEQAAKDTKEEHAALFDRKQSVSALLGSPAPAVQTSIKAAPAPHNALQDNQNAQTRERGTYISNNLNPFAPQTAANTETSTRIVLPKSLIYEQPIARVLFATGLVTSRSEGHRLVAGNGAYVGHQAGVSNNTKLTQMTDQLQFTPAKLHDKSMMWRYVIRDEQPNREGRGGEMVRPGEEGTLILRTGKWKIRVVRIVSDDLFESMGLPDPPGWAEFKAERSRRGNVEALEEAVQPQGSKRKMASKAMEEQQSEALGYLRGRGARPEQLRDAVWQSWNKLKNKDESVYKPSRRVGLTAASKEGVHRSRRPQRDTPASKGVGW